MTIYVEWEFLMGDYSTNPTASNRVPNGATDFSSRTLEMEVTASVDIGKLGRASARIRLDNSDGAFTPAGGGTYEDWDFLANPVYIRAKTGTNPAALTDRLPLFSGAVTGVDFYDDGNSSYIDIDADDMFSLLSRATTDQEYDIIGAPLAISQIPSAVWNLYTPTGSVPKYGAVFVFVENAVTPVDVTAFQELELIVEEGDYVGDAVNELAVAEHGVVLPMLFDCDFIFGFPSQGAIYYRFGYIARNWLWTGVASSPAEAEYEFVEGTPTGTQLPFIRPQVGFDVDYLINQAAATVAGGITQTAAGATIEQYGPRAVDFSNLPMGFDSQALDLAEHLVTRYDTVNYFVRSVSLTGGMVQEKCADAALSVINTMLEQTWIEYSGLSFPGRLHGPLFHPAHVEFTGAGGVTLDSRVAFMAVSYRITPTDWEMTLSDGRDAVTTYGFVMGLADYGVLGTNRLA